MPRGCAPFTGNHAIPCGQYYCYGISSKPSCPGRHLSAENSQEQCYRLREISIPFVPCKGASYQQPPSITDLITTGWTARRLFNQPCARVYNTKTRNPLTDTPGPPQKGNQECMFSCALQLPPAWLALSNVTSSMPCPTFIAEEGVYSARRRIPRFQEGSSSRKG